MFKSTLFCLALGIMSSFTAYGMESNHSQSAEPSDAVQLIAYSETPPQQAQCNTASLDALPSIVVGTILHHLAQNIGTRGFINGKDVPVIVKNVRNLACVNKKLHENVNDDAAVQRLIESVSHRFKKPPVDIAACINTSGSRRWLKNYLHRSGEYELFKMVQKIFTICREMREQAKQFDVNLSDGQEGWPGANPCHNQTRQGLMLQCESYPDSLITPWGEVALFGGGWGKFLGFLFLQQEFFKKVTAHFKATRKSIMDRERVEYYELEKPMTQDDIGKRKFNDHFKKISKNDLETKKDKQTMIISSHCGWDSVYALRAVGPATLPNPELASDNEFRSYNASKLIWKIMDDEFHGKSTAPSENKSKAHPSSASSEKKERNNPAPYEVIPRIELHTISDAPLKYIKLLQHLARQPLFLSEGMVWQEAPCEDYVDCSIAYRLAHNGNRHVINRNERWRIDIFGGGYFHIPIEDQYRNGIKRSTYKNDSPISEAIMQNHFETTISQLQNGWKQASLINNQDIIYTKSEEEWLLFTKSSSVISEEDQLINFFIRKFELSDKINCSNSWNNREDHRQEIYLWIRKDAVQEVQRAFNFRLT